MKSENNQKIKLLKIMDILQQESDEEHPIRTSEFCRRLQEMHISCDTRTLGKDMRFLNEQGYEILYRMLGHEKAYYVMDRSFSVPELRILIDAVQAANFITEKKTQELTAKIAALGGGYRAEILKGSIVRFNTRKHSNESVLYTVDTLEQALLQKKKISFLYFALDENHERVYRFDKRRYTEDPIALIYHEDNYYIMCFNLKWGHVTNYRIDRMADVRMEEEDIDRRTEETMRKLDFAGYTGEAFRMYGGEPKKIKLLFADELLPVVYDKFGEDTKVKRVREGQLEAFVKVQLSTTFFGWICQFPGQMLVSWPPSVVDYIDSLRDGINRIMAKVEACEPFEAFGSTGWYTDEFGPVFPEEEWDEETEDHGEETEDWDEEAE